MRGFSIPLESSDALQVLAAFLDHDQRPIVVVTRSSGPGGDDTSPCITYCNEAARKYFHIDSFEGIGPGTNEFGFSEFATNLSTWAAVEEGEVTDILYDGILWERHPIGQRWGTLCLKPTDAMQINNNAVDDDGFARPSKKRRLSTSGRTALPLSHRHPRETPGPEYLPSPESTTGPSDAHPPVLLDWTRAPQDNLPDYTRMLRKVNWSRTCLGPMEDWSHELRSNIFVVVNNPEPRVLLWGPEHALVYNESCSIMMGKKHPSALGLPGAVGFAEGWPPLLCNIKEVMQTGMSKQVKDHYVPIWRNDLMPEETYFSYTLLPVLDENGTVVGALKELIETTRRVIAERRQETIKKVEKMAVAPKFTKFWADVRNILETNAQDFPFALLYSFDDGSKRADETTATEPPQICTLESVVGITVDHAMASAQLELHKEGQGLESHFRRALSIGSPVLLRKSDGSLPKWFGVRFPDRGLGGTCTSALICPVRRLDSTGAIGFLLLGLNPQRPFDDDYNVFINLVVDHLVRAAASIIVPIEQSSLLRRTESAERKERTFTRLAEMAPVGIAIFTTKGSPVWMNDAYVNLSGVGQEKHTYEDWTVPLHPDDRSRGDVLFETLLERPHAVTLEVRVRQLNARPEEAQWQWMLWNGISEADDNGHVTTITSFLTDISDQKRIEKLQTQRLEDLLEAKRQSENFIDMTCHEMRNPLSAMIQSADGIISAFESMDPSNITNTQNTVIEAAQTIVLCAQHQKRIVDDILTLSKLDSNLLLISPDRVKPASLARKILQMYAADLQNADVAASLSIDQSFVDLAIDTVFLDPARLSQVLINLITNAIKFTTNAKERSITIVLGASREQPYSGLTKVSYIPRGAPRLCSQGEDWGAGEEIFLQFDVVDTGRGLTPEEMKLMFLRFSQASPKTYAQYGGSGLGLFISRELTELQGGQIGVHSVAGQGSTFTFYIKTRRYVPTGSRTCSLSDPLSAVGTPSPAPRIGAAASTLAGDSADSSVFFHILLVEDNVINQRVLAQYLIREGCVVHVANHGAEALDFLARTAYFSPSSLGRQPESEAVPLDIILMDLEMPFMDGLTCVRRIREMQREGTINAHIPIIAITANARKEQISKALETGMDDVVTKPFRIPELLPKITELARRINATEVLIP